ncbi:hypothetical protein GR183_21230 [Stappia sp. GBMRC 2046]|uniref:O-antigen ligase-related domain-containing protein n=1 Tax=Stappia sediminis TaxID=2692190 RepID=A0A7X3SA05_9HYPH|nr:O-antigen ligase family protein [Stappia sediminis]MXN67438.1 hypothetical protein [Stappia sediminis]
MTTQLQSPHRPAGRMKPHRIEFYLTCIFVYLAPMNVLQLPFVYFTASDGFACICFLTMIVHHSLNVRPFVGGTFLWVIGLSTMIGALFFSSLVAGVPARGLILGAQYFFAYLVVPLILLTRNQRETEILLKVYVASIVTVVLHGIYVIHITGETNTIFVSGNGRLLGLVQRINAGGAVMALTIPLVLSMIRTKIFSPIFGYAIVVLITYGVMLVASNTALSGLVFGVGLYLILSANFQRIVLVGCFVALAIAALSFTDLHAILPEAFQRRVLTGLEAGDISEAGTFSDRMLLNSEAIQFAKDTMWIGLGADQYRVISQYDLPVHNFYLLIWNEGGLIALVGFIAMILGAVVLIVYAWQLNTLRSSTQAATATLAMFLFLINANAHIYGRFLVVPMLITLSPLAVALRRLELPKTRIEKSLSAKDEVSLENR